MKFDIVLQQVLILFIILLIGFIGGKANVLDRNATRVMTNLLLFISSPMLVLRAFLFEYSAERLRNAGLVFAVGLLLIVIAVVVSKFLYMGFSEAMRPVLRFTAVFSNCGYMGLPLMKAIFGDEGVFYGSFYIILFQMTLWSYGLMMFGDKGGIRWKKIFLNPSMVAIYVGIGIFVLRIPVPDTIRLAAGSVGDMTMPLSMLIVGALISTEKLSSVFSDLRVYFASAVRLILMPLIGWGVTTLLHMPGITGAVLVTALAMPAATNTAIFAEYNGKDSVTGSKIVAVSTLLAIATAPVLIAWAAG